MKKKLFLIDASPIFYKAFFAIPHLSSKNGVPTNGAYGYTSTLIKFLKDHKPEYIGICFDKGSSYRKEIFSAYKMDRKEMPSNLKVQIDIIKELTNALGLRVVEKNGYEADDLIGALAVKAEKEGFEVVVVSPDKDLCQLITENISVLDLNKKKHFTMKNVHERFEVEAKNVVDLLGLSGDVSDGIPGVMGIGPKTAINLIKKYGSIENIYANLAEIKGSTKEKLEKGKEAAFLSKKLATIIKDEEIIPILSLKELEKHFSDKEKLKNLFLALNFYSMTSRLGDIE